MNYRAAATRSLKDAPAGTAAKPASSGPSNPESPAGNSPRMKGNSGARTSSQSSNRKANTGTPLSYAATAAKKGSGADASGARRGAGGRTAGTPPALPLTSLVNARVEIDLINGDRAEGVLFTYDVYSGIVALISASTADDSRGSKKHTVRLVKASNIRDVRVVGDKSDIQMPIVRAVTTAEIEARKARALVQAKERASRIGVGVSEHAQSIFEALSKTLPCRWDQSRIIVLDEIAIDPPYTADTCRELTSAASTLLRVKKVLQGELGRLGRATPVG
ncbi:hypothetical protein GGH12_001829 [Coemansia sp. RSA 1822]|nr:hypothetical protein LPJ76_002072 [Coemansia sp. RSA 638]KAJ2122821.1 hypothetical protein IW147_003105 [Coemansia sp. RSA 720]KAJ2543873.1 hypothetical protein GGF49_001720 [Coemansia sp. RSA 1853]KAJ2564755.1 hypothetical protein GGH12_001829 [Coemansia sp. RSA 1822]